MSTPQTPPAFGPALRVSDLASGEPHPFLVEPSAETCAEIAKALGLIGLRKVRFTGTLAPLGKRNWSLEAKLGATVIQECVVTLAPVTTRIEETAARLYIAGLTPPEGDEVEMTDAVDEEPLGAEINLGNVMVEALALALPTYPRAADADLGEAVFTKPGDTPMTDDDAKPFAGLAALRDKLSDDD